MGCQFDARYVDQSTLRVEGLCEGVPTELEFRPGNEGIIDEPDLIALELRAQPGTKGPAKQQVVWEKDVGDAVRRVRIYGEGSATLMVAPFKS